MYVRSKHSPRLFFARLLTSTCPSTKPSPLSLLRLLLPYPGAVGTAAGGIREQSKSLPVTPLLSILQYLPSNHTRIKISTPDHCLAGQWDAGAP